MCYLVAIGVAVAKSDAEAGFNQASVKKMTSVVWVEIVSQIWVAYLQSERALNRMQWS